MLVLIESQHAFLVGAIGVNLDLQILQGRYACHVQVSFEFG
jgi:hypothetical protein